MDKGKILEKMEKTEKILFSELDLERFGFKNAQSLRNDRYRGVGLPYVKMGPRGSVKYLRSDLVKFLAENRIVPDGE